MTGSPRSRSAFAQSVFALRRSALLLVLLPLTPALGAPSASPPPARKAGPAAPAKPAAPAAEPAGELWTPFQSDFPFQTSCVTAPYPAKNTAYKSVSMRLGPGAAMNFDTDLLRMATGWTGAFLTPNGVAFDTTHGGHPQVAGDVKFGTRPTPGWGDAQGKFEDPRTPQPYGPLPETWGRWDGLYTVEQAVVLAYTVHGTKVHEQPSAVTRDGRTAFVRTFKIDEAKTPLSLLVADVEGAAGGPGAGEGGRRRNRPSESSGSDLDRQLFSNGRLTSIAVRGAPAGAKLETLPEGRVVLRLPKGRYPGLFKVVVWNGVPGDRALVAPLFAGAPAMVDFLRGGRPHFPTPIVTKGERGTGAGPYVVDRLTTPFPGSYYRGTIADWKDNVYKRRIMIAGFDFFPDGKRAALATWEGDVWIVEGIDDALDHLTWRRFASGGYETLGLKIVNGAIYTTGRDQITRYHDLNGDGEADYYENFNNQVLSTTGFHEFQFDLQTDKQGNFYTAKAGPVRSGGRGFGGGGGNGEITRFSGTVQKISKDGRKREIYATGFRAPNGIGVGPDGQVTTGDNEGSWVPACPINWVSPGSFHGVEDLTSAKPAPKMTLPLCWISKAYDNSGGGQVWVESDKWGPWKGELLHLSYGRASVYLVLKQKVGDVMQGGIVRIVGGSDAVQLSGTAQKLTSSAMRGRFNPHDGQLYVVGLAGWQTDAVAVTGFDRIRYTGKPVYSARGLEVTGGAVKLSFTQALDPASVNEQNVSVERWNYRRTSEYGSPELSVSDPGRSGHDPVDVLSATLGPDGKTVTLALDDLRPANQVLIKLKLKAVDGTPIRQTVMHTIHVVPKDPHAPVAAGPTRRAKPGLTLTFTGRQAQPGPSASKDVTEVPNVALYVPAGRSASPLVPPGPFEAVWEGTLVPELRGEFSFQVELAGQATLELNGKKVLETNKTIVSSPVPLDKGDNRLRVIYRSPEKGDAFLRLAWRGDARTPFDPIPPTALRLTENPDRDRYGLVRKGRGLFLAHRCAACHLNGPAASPELAMDAPRLDGIGGRRFARWMESWIAAPRGGRGVAQMPALLHGATAPQDARAIAAYLATLGNTPAGHAPAPAEALVAKGEDLWTNLACQGCHSPPLHQLSDDGKLPLQDVPGKFPAGTLAAFLRAPEEHFRWTRMPNFHLSPDEAEALSAFLHARLDPPEPPSPVSRGEAATIARGRTLVQTAGCLRCHGLALANQAPMVDLAPRLLAGKAPAARSCLGGSPAADYRLSVADREALTAFLKEGGLASLSRHAPVEFVARQVEELGCRRCHGQLDGFPALDGLGGKLRPEWAADFIGGKIPYKPRPVQHADGHPWLATRMPAFPARAALLAEGLAASHGVAPRTPAEPAIDRAAAKLGGTLVSANGGFACVTCHAVGPSAATQVFETEGVNLAYASERLLPGFFRRWVRNPLKVDPTTKMPVYFDEEGKSPVTTILGGDGDKQIEALWQHLREVGAPRALRASAP